MCDFNSDSIDDVQWKMVLVGHSHWIQLKAFSSSSHANKCIIDTTLEKKDDHFLHCLRTVHTALFVPSIHLFGGVTYSKCHMLFHVFIMFYLNYKPFSSFPFLSPTFQRSRFMCLNGASGVRKASVTFSQRYFMIFSKAKRGVSAMCAVKEILGSTHRKTQTTTQPDLQQTWCRRNGQKVE